ncbi:hypothetical protein LSTR_LSTR001118 [Laodelphax striatellus]|uniref:Uncharacterized protein n=1 Tax=Laodelphax striatellus TaxID=195883 RepID=A0A482X158_LAOST|nr:hypothetical protein LSTR_LSTR001118 [Laodelphax striatellus]
MIIAMLKEDPLETDNLKIQVGQLSPAGLGACVLVLKPVGSEWDRLLSLTSAWSSQFSSVFSQQSALSSVPSECQQIHGRCLSSVFLYNCTDKNAFDNHELPSFGCGHSSLCQPQAIPGLQLNL